MKNPKKTVCIYFQVHQPYRLSETSFFEENAPKDYFEGPSKAKNKDVFEKVANKCYLPATSLILDLLKKHPEFRVSYSFSGTFLDQCEEYGEIGKKVLDLFKEISRTGQAEILGETSHHTLSFLYSKDEYADQIKNHAKRIEQVFGSKPKVFRNTELIFNNEVAEFIRNLGFHGMLAEGWDKYLMGRNPNHIYSHKPVELHPSDYDIAKRYRVHGRIKKVFPVLLKNYKLSDDIAFRFGNKGWEEHPLTTEKFAHWVDASPGDTINLFMDYETLGEHQWEDTGIFEFLKHLPQALKNKDIHFRTPSETIEENDIKDTYDVPEYMSWADTDRDLSAWASNEIQRSAIEELSNFEKELYAYKFDKNSEIQNIVRDFRRLQTSDHMYYMCTKYWNDGDVHKYFSPYSSEHSPYEAYVHFMNTLRHLRERLNAYKTKIQTKNKKQYANAK